jgi:hypothetical protein
MAASTLQEAATGAQLPQNAPPCVTCTPDEKLEVESAAARHADAVWPCEALASAREVLAAAGLSPETERSPSPGAAAAAQMDRFLSTLVESATPSIPTRTPHSLNELHDLQCEEMLALRAIYEDELSTEDECAYTMRISPPETGRTIALVRLHATPLDVRVLCCCVEFQEGSICKAQ